MAIYSYRSAPDQVAPTSEEILASLLSRQVPKKVEEKPSYSVEEEKFNEPELVYHRHPMSSWKEGFEDWESLRIDEDSYGDRCKYLCMKRYCPAPMSMPPICKPTSSLEFTSEFESGNLWKAYKVSPEEYILHLQYDTETADYCHWYYFNVKNKLPGTVRFHIVNMMRPEPLILEGMQPLAWSAKQHSIDRTPWVRSGEDIVFKESSKKEFSLSFTYNFEHSDDSVYFAYSYPYTYSKLTNFLQDLSAEHPETVHVDTLTRTLCGNICYYLTITSPQNTAKKAIVVTCRVHCGETNSSYILEGFLKQVVNDFALLKEFVFYVVPMLNPDGVRHGNYRCSCLGVDLNRRWQTPHRVLHPTVYHTKQLIASVLEKLPVAMFCDIHGHSKKKGVFMYGCLKQPKKSTMVLPVLMAGLNPHFLYSECHYRLDKAKESTARISVYKQFSIAHSYTLEASLYGYQSHFSIEDLENIGRDLAKACHAFVTLKSAQEKAEAFLTLWKKGKKEANNARRSQSNQVLLGKIGEAKKRGKLELVRKKWNLSNSQSILKKKNQILKSTSRKIYESKGNLTPATKNLFKKDGEMLPCVKVKGGIRRFNTTNLGTTGRKIPIKPANSIQAEIRDDKFPILISNPKT